MAAINEGCKKEVGNIAYYLGKYGFCIITVSVSPCRNQPHIRQFVCFLMIWYLIHIEMQAAATTLCHLEAMSQQGKTRYICTTVNAIVYQK